MSTLRHAANNAGPEIRGFGSVSISTAQLMALERAQSVRSNFNLATGLFDELGLPQKELRELLASLPLRGADGRHVLEIPGASTDLRSIENVLQNAFFRKNAGAFSFEVQNRSGPPDAVQGEAFDAFRMREAIAVPAERKADGYDVAVIFGGTLEAVAARTRWLLQQGVEFRGIALLGGKRPLIPSREGSADFERVLGFKPEPMPTTETEMMQIVWDTFAKDDAKLGRIPKVTIDSQLRTSGEKSAPGTPETVVDLAEALLDPRAIECFGKVATKFLLASSQPHVMRQSLDFVTKMIRAGYPLEVADGIGYAPAASPSLELLGNELAKAVHCIYELRGSPMGFPELFKPAHSVATYHFQTST